MAVGKDKDYAARLRTATEQADGLNGFSLVGQAVTKGSWAAPGAEKMGENAPMTRGEIEQAVNNALSKIRETLNNPNIMPDQRAELMERQVYLEGVQSSLATGASVNPQISAGVNAAVTSVNAIATVVSSGNNAQIMQVAAQAGVSAEYVRNFGGYVVTPNMSAEQARETVLRGFEFSQKAVDKNNQSIVAHGGTLAGSEQDRERWAREEEEAKRNGDIDKLRKIQEERLAAEKKALEEAEAKGQPKEVVKGHQSNITIYEQRIKEMDKARNIEMQKKIALGEITAAEAEQANLQYAEALQHDKAMLLAEPGTRKEMDSRFREYAETVRLTQAAGKMSAISWSSIENKVSSDYSNKSGGKNGIVAFGLDDVEAQMVAIERHASNAQKGDEKVLTVAEAAIDAAKPAANKILNSEQIAHEDGGTSSMKTGALVQTAIEAAKPAVDKVGDPKEADNGPKVASVAQTVSPASGKTV